jgi:uncharacterized repeat protein (TIGR03899 family)
MLIGIAVGELRRNNRGVVGVSDPLISLEGLTEPISKLVEAVRSGVGVLYEPTQIRRRAKAEADAAIIKAEGDIKVQEIAQRASDRVNNREMRRQRNIEAVVEGAKQHLPKSVNNEKVDEDWIAQFFENCQDVGNEQMQTLWAKLLAGEVASPGTYSLRALALIKTLTKKDADLFTQFCGYTWTEEGQPGRFHIFTKGTEKLLTDKGMDFFSLNHLQAIGLVDANFATRAINEGDSVLLNYFGHPHIFSPVFTVSADTKVIQTFSLTSIGQELAPISGAQPDEEYRVILIQSLRNERSIKVEVV